MIAHSGESARGAGDFQTSTYERRSEAASGFRMIIEPLAQMPTDWAETSGGESGVVGRISSSSAPCVVRQHGRGSGASAPGLVILQGDKFMSRSSPAPSHFPAVCRRNMTPCALALPWSLRAAQPVGKEYMPARKRGREISPSRRSIRGRDVEASGGGPHPCADRRASRLSWELSSSALPAQTAFPNRAPPGFETRRGLGKFRSARCSAVACG